MLQMVDMNYNGNAGITLNSNSQPNFYLCNSEGNYYGLYKTNPNEDIIPVENLTITNNTYNGFVIAGGTISSDRHWTKIPHNYIIVGNITIGKYHDHCRLTVEPGNTVKVDTTHQIQVGYSQYGGELYAVGIADSIITFTSFNGSSGGWDGIYFENCRFDFNRKSM